MNGMHARRLLRGEWDPSLADVRNSEDVVLWSNDGGVFADGKRAYISAKGAIPPE